MRSERTLFLRFVFNGLAATIVHFTVLYLNMELLGFRSAGLANAVAAIFGITASFVGSRFFVFRARSAPAAEQFVRFFALYACIALLHGFILFVWSDLLKLDYRGGFLVATGVQVMLSFYGNKTLVFRT